MSVAPLIQNTPNLIRLSDGRIVPLGSLGALPPTPAAATGGTVQAPDTTAAGDISGVLPLASTNASALSSITPTKGRGGAANPGNIPTGGADKSKVISAPEGSDDMSGVSALAKALGKNAGTANGAPGSPGNTGAGFVDKVKDFLGLGGDNSTNTDTTGATIPPPIPVQTNVLPPISQDPAATPGAAPMPPDATVAQAVPPAAALPPPGQQNQPPGLIQRLGNALGINATPQAATQPAGALPPGVLPAQAVSTTPPLVSGGGFLDGIIDHGDPLMQGEQGETMKARYGDSYHSPDWFERLQANPTRLALLTGGLSTMAAASKPGARWAGSIGEGALTGLNTVYERQAAAKKQDLEAAKETSEADLRKQQGVFYGQRGSVLQQNADVNADYKGTMGDAATVRANADTVKADAAMKKAQTAANGTNNPTALMKNAKFYVDSGIAPDTATAISMVRQSVSNPAQQAALVTARAKYILGTNLNPSQNDMDNALTQARTQVSQEMKDASPSKGTGGALPSNGVFVPAKTGSPAKSAGALPPKVGTVVSGYSFQGGNPNDPKAWKKN